MGLTLHLYGERTSKYRIRHSTYWSKVFTIKTVELVQIDDATRLESLCSILGKTIANHSFNVVIAITEEKNHDI
jgi:hypothetical protein